MIFKNQITKIKKITVTLLLFPIFLYDYLNCLRSDKFTSSKASYLLLRYIYSLSKGLSKEILSIPFSLRYPIKNKKSAITSSINKKGYAFITADNTSTKLCEIIKSKSLNYPVFEDVPNNIKESKKFNSFKDINLEKYNQCARLKHEPSDIASIPEVWELVKYLNLDEIASNFLNCKALLTEIHSWYVIPVLNNKNKSQLYSKAAQTFHYDLDWIKWLKFFINLDDVEKDNGPFEFIPYSNNTKDNFYYKDGRFENLLPNTKTAIKAIGPIGTTFISDTSGLHRDGRCSTKYRQVLLVEFAVSQFGAKFIYNNRFKRISEILKSDKNIRLDYSDRSFNLFI